MATPKVKLTLENEVSLVEGMDDYMSWRASYPVGALLAKRMERNSRLPLARSLHDMHKEEQAHIANRLDYVGSKPDKEIRWTLC